MVKVDGEKRETVDLKGKQVLIVEDDRSMRKGLTLELSDRSLTVIECDTFESGQKAIKSGKYDILITDLRLDSDNEGFDLITLSKQVKSEAPALIITAFGSIDAAVRAMKLGADDFLIKGFTIDELLLKMERLFERQLLLKNREILSSQVSELSKEIDKILPKWEIIGESSIITRLRKQIGEMSKTNFTVLITGETGTGKELVARAFHRASVRRTKPFAIVNCSAIPGDLIESELFGYEKGAFSGAVAKKVGQFESADKGIIFLDEIGDLALPLQPKLLRCIEYKEFNRIGGTKPVKVDVQIIAATNRNLPDEVQRGNFRRDLLYRLNVLHLHIPPLRERSDDIPILAKHFLQGFSREFSGKEYSFAADAQRILLSYTWPGNVRELKNIVIKAVALSPEPQISGTLLNQLLLDDFQIGRDGDKRTEHLRAAVCSPQGQEINPELYNSTMNMLNLLFAQEAMKQSAGKIRSACRKLGISRNTFRKILLFQSDTDSSTDTDDERFQAP